MLKKPAPGKSSRYLGIAFVAALCFGASLAVWSSQPAKVVPAPDDANFMYETRMDTEVDGDTQKDIVVRQAPGNKAMIVQGEGERKWTFEFSLRPEQGNRVWLDSTLRRGEEVVGKPKLLIEKGRQAGIEVSTKDGSSVFKLKMQVTEWRDSADTNTVLPYRNQAAAYDNLAMFRQMAAQREYTRLQTEPNASWRRKMKISFIVEPRKPPGKDDGC